MEPKSPTYDAEKPQMKDEVEEILHGAAQATAKEHKMSLWQGIKLYPKAIGWSLLISTAIIMEGYDITLINSFYAQPTFSKKYGHLQSNGKYGLSASWQAGLGNGMSCGQIIGLFINGIASDRWGYRRTMMVSLVATAGFIFILFFAPNIQTLLVGEILLGIPLGVYQTLSVTYASEVCPVALRAYLTTYINLCWVIGQLIASGIQRGFVNRTDQWGYRIPFALQWIWPIPIFIGVWLAPESPWWLVRKGRTDDAVASLKRLTSKGDTDFNPDETVAMMVHTNEMEKQINSGTSYWDCFKGVDLRRTEITCAIWAAQNLCGAGLMGYSTYFFQRAGVPEERSFDFSIGMYALGFVGTVLSWVLMSYFGRRTIYVNGLAMLTVILLVVGFIAIPAQAVATSTATGSMLMIYAFFYDISIGPVCYSLVAEVPTTRLRIKTVVLARNVYNIIAIINNVIIPYMLNPDEWNWAGKAGFFWGGLCGLCLVWAYFRVPEPRGRTFAEMDALFESGVSARKFRRTKVDLFDKENSSAEVITAPVKVGAV